MENNQQNQNLQQAQPQQENAPAAAPATAPAAPAPSTPKPAFRSTTFGGYDKQSVLSYIYELNNNAKLAQDKLNSQLEELSTAREQLSKAVKEMEGKLNKVESENEDLRSELGTERARTNELSAMIDRLSDEIEKQRKIIEKKDEEISRFEDLNNQLHTNNAELEEKRIEFEKSSVIISELIVRARNEADQILEEANGQAKQLVVEAGRSLLDVNNQFGIFRKEMEAIEQKIESAVITMQRKFADIGEAIELAESNIRESCNFQRNSELKLVSDKNDELKSFLGSEKRDFKSFFRNAAEN